MSDVFPRFIDESGAPLRARRWVIIYEVPRDDVEQSEKLKLLDAHYEEAKDSDEGFEFQSREGVTYSNVFYDAYERDDSDPKVQKRRVVLIHMGEESEPRGDEKGDKK